MKTKTSNPKKTFDAVKYMRDQRDRISKDIMDMSPEEVVAYFAERAEKSKKEG